MSARLYYSDDAVTLYHGDFRDGPWTNGDLIVADPPYGATSLRWDRWVRGWPKSLLGAARQMWVFGMLRTFMERAQEFADWTLAQDIVWEKHNGSNFAADRFKRVHEQAAHFYTGEWFDLYRSPQFTMDATKRTIRRKRRPPHMGNIGEHTFVAHDGGPRLQRSVIRMRSCHGSAVNETQKPAGFVHLLVEYACQPGGTVLSPFAGGGTDLVVAKESGRRGVGWDIREDQCEEAAKRLMQGTLELGA